jgi:hypothetical protein
MGRTLKLRVSKDYIGIDLARQHTSLVEGVFKSLKGYIKNGYIIELEQRYSKDLPDSGTTINNIKDLKKLEKKILAP